MQWVCIATHIMAQAELVNIFVCVVMFQQILAHLELHKLTT